MVQHDSLRVSAYHRLREKLFKTPFNQGEFLSPRKIAKTMGISHTPVREALIQLETEGIVELIPNQGVRPKTLDRQELCEMFEMRIVIESGAARLASKKITDQQLQNLRRIHTQSQNLLPSITNELPNDGSIGIGPDDARQNCARLNFLFHLSVISASENRKLIKATSDLHLLTKLLNNWVTLPGDTPFREAQRQSHFHGQILHALEIRDPEGAALSMTRHITDAMEHHLKVYDLQETLKRQRQSHSYYWPPDFLQAIRQLEQQLEFSPQDSPHP